MTNYLSWFARWQSDNQAVQPGGQVLIRHKGEILFQENFGYADIEHQIPITDETVFHVASVSKQFTVMATLLLIEEQNLSLDDPIQKYLPDLVKITHPITLRQLCQNVSGLRDQWELFMLAGDRIDDTLTQADALSVISRQQTLNFPPQSHYMYSNSNFTLLATLIERLSGRSLNDYLSRKIFEPLGMTKSQVKADYWQVIPNRALSYYDNFQGEFLNYVLNYGTYGATSLHTNALDLLKWLDNFRDMKVGSQSIIETMLQVPQLIDPSNHTSYAGGLFIGELEGHRYFEHSGVDAGYRAQVVSFIDDQLDIIILANTQSLPIGQIAFNLARQILGLEVKDLRAELEKETPSRIQKPIIYPVYYYQTSDASPVLIRLQDDGDQLKIHFEYDQIPLEQTHPGLYRIPYANQFLDFRSDPAQLISAKSREHIKSLEKVTVKDLLNDDLLGDYYSPELETVYSIVQVSNTIEIRHRRNGQEPLYKVDDQSWAFGQMETYLLEWQGSDFTLSAGRSRQIKFIKCQLPQLKA